MHEAPVSLRIENEEPLIEQYIDSLSPGTFDHELSPRLAENRSGLVNELAGICLYAKVYTSLRVGYRGAFYDCHGLSSKLARK